jgi:hypothetical protein
MARNPCYTDYVANLTLAIDEDLLRRARIKALEDGTSVNALVREQLERYAGESEAAAGLKAFLRETERTNAGSGPGGRTWTREDLYER